MKAIKKLALMVLVATVLTTLAITVNYYSNVEKNSAHMQATGHELIDGEWRTKEWSEMD